jgi:mRNA interferase MazF
VRRGEIRWYTFAAPDKRRPVLLPTRDVIIDSLGEIVAPATRTIRESRPRSSSLPTTACPSLARTFDHVSLARKERIGAVLAALPDARWPEMERALLVACGFRQE